MPQRETSQREDADLGEPGTAAKSRAQGPLRLGGTGEAACRPSAASAERSPDAERAVDERIVGRIRSGDADACAELVDRYQGRIFRMIRRMWPRERETVEDLCQEVFLRVFRGLGGFAGDCSLGTWVHRITTNVCITEFRARRTLKRDRPTLSLDAPVARSDGDDGLHLEAVSDEPDPSEAGERRELYRACEAAIQELPPLFRVILVLRDVEGRSYEEIAAELALPIGTVRSRLHRARSRLRVLVEGPAEGEAR